MNEHKAFTSINVLSQEQAKNSKSGAAVIKGGLGVGNNVYVEKEVNCHENIVRENCRIGGSLYINGDIHVNRLLQNNSIENIVYLKKHLAPIEHLKYNLGTEDKKWNQIYSSNIISTHGKISNLTTHHLDVKNNISLGSTSNHEPLVKIDHHGMICKSDVFFQNKNYQKLLSMDQNTNYVHAPILKYDFLSIEPQFIKINKESMYIPIEKSLILLEVYENTTLGLRLKDKMNTDLVIRLLVKQKHIESLNVILYFNSLEYVIFLGLYNYIDLLAQNGHFTYLGGNITPYQKN
jgi:hypothetical protein